MMVGRLVWRHLVVAVAAAALVALAVGIPSALVVNPIFARMTPAPWWSYAVWVLTAVLSGVLAATYVGRPAAASSFPRRAGILANTGSLLAVGCPVCNKLVVAAIGVSGALGVWAPLQPLIAAAALVLLGWALRRRLVALRSCPAVGGVPASAPATLAPATPERER